MSANEHRSCLDGPSDAVCHSFASVEVGNRLRTARCELDNALPARCWCCGSTEELTLEEIGEGDASAAVDCKVEAFHRGLAAIKRSWNGRRYDAWRPLNDPWRQSPARATTRTLETDISSRRGGKLCLQRG